MYGARASVGAYVPGLADLEGIEVLEEGQVVDCAGTRKAGNTQARGELSSNEAPMEAACA